MRACVEYTWDNGPNRVSGPQTRLETSGTGIRQNRLVLADVTEYIYLPQSTFTLRFVLFGQKKRRSRGEVAVSMEKRSWGWVDGGGFQGWEITGCHGDALNQKYGRICRRQRCKKGRGH